MLAEVPKIRQKRHVFSPPLICEIRYRVCKKNGSIKRWRIWRIVKFSATYLSATFFRSDPFPRVVVLLRHLPSRHCFMLPFYCAAVIFTNTVVIYVEGIRFSA